jgi:hypothetical protein
MHKFNLQIIVNAKGSYSAKVSYFDYTTQKDSTLYVCSRVDPILEGDTWAENEYSEEKTLFIIYGLGLGYHINALAQRLKPNQKIIAMEVCTALYTELQQYDNKCIEKLKSNAQIECVISDQMTELIKVFNRLSDKDTHFSIYQPMVKLIPKSLHRVREIIEDYMVNTRTIVRDQEYILQNCEYNETCDYQEIDSFKKTYTDKPIVVVSAGPSLDNTIHILRQVQDKVYIFSTGRVLKALINRQIRVDLFCIIDAHYLATYPQIQGLEDLSIPFVFLNSANYKTVECYKGPKYMAYGNTRYVEKKQEIAQQLESNGSVAIATIDLAIKLGGNPIILLGQDLAYTNMKSHANDARAEEIMKLPNIKQVKNQNGEYISTAPGLLSIKHGLEKKIAKHPNVNFINCSTGGAYINGCQHYPLNEILF